LNGGIKKIHSLPAGTTWFERREEDPGDIYFAFNTTTAIPGMVRQRQTTGNKILLICPHK
jgi:hypothetical protein